MVSGNQLKVTVINGRGLKCKDISKDVCPYCVLQSGSTIRKTRYISNNPNPLWNEDFLFDVDSSSEVLSFSIWHKNTKKNDVVIGYAFVDFGTCKKGEKSVINISLQGVYSGEIKLSVLPRYETTASKVERLERDVSFLRYELANHDCRNKILEKQVEELTLVKSELVQKNEVLEKEKAVLLEYDVLSVSNPSKLKRTASNISYDIVSLGSPVKVRQAFSSDIFFPIADNKLKCIEDTSVNFDEFDIISDMDVDKAADRRQINQNQKRTVEQFIRDNDNDEFIITSEVKDDVLQGADIFEDKIGTSHRKHKQDRIEEEDEEEEYEIDLNSLNENIMNSLASRVTVLEEENTKLKLVVQQMQIDDGDELGQLIDDLDNVEECDRCSTSLKSKINHIKTFKQENDSKYTLIKELISSLNESMDRVEADEYEDNLYVDDSNIEDEDLGGLVNNEGDVDENKREKKKNFSPAIYKEYFWDEYLPMSTPTKCSNNTLENESKHYGDGCDDEMTEDIDDFIKNNYLFHNENALMLKSDPEFYTKSEMEEENEHVKNVNVKLIRENEDLNSCLHVLQVQVQNLKRFQSILFDQLIYRVPSCIGELTDRFNDHSEVLNEDQVTLYKSYLGSVFDEMVGLGGRQDYQEKPRRDGCKFAVSLQLHHQLPVS